MSATEAAPSLPDLDAPQLEWHLYLEDADRSTCWTNHGYVLQFVCVGYGLEPEDAWVEAQKSGRVPNNYDPNEPPTVAILDFAHQMLVP